MKQQAFLILGLGLALAACSGGSGDGESSDTSTEASGSSSDGSTGSSSSSSSETNASASADGDATASDTSNDDSSEDGSGGCETGFSCIPEVPGGWNGPVILAENPGGDSPGCSGDYPNEVVTDIFVGLNAEEADCGCSCGEPTNVVCKGDLNRSLPGDSSCGAIVNSQEIQTDQCSYITVMGDEYAWMDNAYLFSGVCTSAPSENLPEPTWDAGASVCQAADQEFEACDDGVCVPYDARLCVYRDGTDPCPMGFPYEFTAWEDYFDDRACSGCVCEVEENCTGTISMYQSGAGLCNTPSPDTFSGDGSCYDAPSGGIQSVFWEVEAMSCGVSQPSNPMGQVVPTNGTRVCCTSEG